MHIFLFCLVALLANPSLSDGAFDWLRVMKYHMDICTVLRAMTEASQSQAGVPQVSSDSHVNLQATAAEDDDDNDDVALPLKQHSAGKILNTFQVQGEGKFVMMFNSMQTTVYTRV